MTTDPLKDLLASLRLPNDRDGRPCLLVNEGGHWCSWSAVPLPDGKTMIHAAFPLHFAQVKEADDLLTIDVVLPAGFDVKAVPDEDPNAGRGPG